MSMIKRFYEAETITIEFYSNAHVRRVEFKRQDDDSYVETYETIGGRGTVLERAQMREPITIEEVENLAIVYVNSMRLSAYISNKDFKESCTMHGSLVFYILEFVATFATPLIETIEDLET